MDEIFAQDILKAGQENPLPRDEAIKLLTVILTLQIELGNIEGDALKLATEMVDRRDADEEAQKLECPHCGMTVHQVKDGFIWHADPTAAPCEE